MAKKSKSKPARYPRICFDRVLPPDLMRHAAISQPHPGMPARAIAVRDKPWMNGTTLHVKFLAGTSAQQNLVRQQAAWWSAVANIHFDFNNAANAEIRIGFDSNDGAWSYIGTDCRSIPLNQSTMNLGFLDGGTAAHEFGHAIGLAHEHQNPAGGIEWKEDIVIRDMAGSPNFWSPEMTRHNILDKYSADQVIGTEFDPHSIMLYFFPGTWTVSGVGTEANDTLSEMDKLFVAGPRMYPKTTGTVSNATPLQIDVRTAASIGTAGEEDLYQFKVAQGGRYVIATSGPTDVVMRLFGPNSETALIAEDDDSGADTNSRIVADLLPGQYFVQIRHYSKLRTGKYSILVKKM